MRQDRPSRKRSSSGDVKIRFLKAEEGSDKDTSGPGVLGREAVQATTEMKRIRAKTAEPLCMIRKRMFLTPRTADRRAGENHKPGAVPAVPLQGYDIPG
jgi:hypothetical protein